MPAQQALPWGMPQPEAFPHAPAEPEALPDAAAESPLPINVGRIASEYLRASYGEHGDKSHYGLEDKNGQFYIGKDPIEIDGNALRQKVSWDPRSLATYHNEKARTWFSNKRRREKIWRNYG